MTQLWPEGLPIQVELIDGKPAAFFWQHHRRLIRVIDHWKIHDDWWHDEVWRYYLLVETVDGLLGVLYQDLLTGQWFLERLYD
jgi:hypothetical protein